MNTPDHDAAPTTPPAGSTGIATGSATGSAGPAGPPAWIVIVALTLLCCVPYGQTLGHGFVDWDDDDYITANEHVNRGLTTSGVVWAFTESHASNWHPVTWISHMIDCELFGLAPAGHHAMNLVLHALAAIALFFALRTLTGAGWASAAVAAMLALHPLRVESVAWASERKDVLSGLFFALTILAYGRYARSPSIGRYALVVGALALGLMSKSMLVTVPCVLLLLDYWPLARKASPKTLLLEKAPLFGLAALTALIATQTQAAGGAVSTLASIDLVGRLANAVTSTALYVWMTVWPTNLAFFYPHPAFLGGDVVTALYLPAAISAAILVILTIAAYRMRRRLPFALIGWLWFVGMLVPVSGIVQVGAQQMADRYSYLPSIGLYVLLVWSLRQYVRRDPAALRPVVAGLAVLLVAWTTLSTLQARHWRTSFTLAARAIEATGDNYMAHNLAGRAFDRRGDLAAATKHFERVVALAPDFATGQLNLGACYARTNRLDRAEACLERALRLEPGNPTAITNLAGVYQARGDSDRAIPMLRALLERAPQAIDARFSLACALHQAKRLDEAVAEYARVLVRRPDHAGAGYNLGTLELSRGELSAASTALERLLRHHPSHVGGLNSLALVRERQRRNADAIRLLRHAVGLDPTHRAARRNLERLTASRVN